MKKLMIILVVIAVATAVFFGARHFFGRLDGLLEREIETAASEAFGTRVTIDDVEIKMLDGAVNIANLAIGNPEGFNSEHAFVFGNIEASVDFKSMSVERVVLDEVQINVEENDGLINVQELKKAIESKMSKTVVIGDPRGAESEEELHIQQFLMRSTTATLESDTWEKVAELDIDEIEMRDLRGTPDEVAEQIADRVIEEITDEAQKALVRAQAEELESKAMDKLKELLGDDDDGG